MSNKGRIDFCFLCMDDILLAQNNTVMINATKEFLSSNFEIKDMGEANYMLRVKIPRDHLKGYLVCLKKPI